MCGPRRSTTWITAENVSPAGVGVQQILDWVGKTVGISSDAVSRLLLTIAVAASVLIIRWGFIAILNRRSEDPRVRYRWRKTTTYLLSILGLLLVGRIWLAGIQSLVTYLGLVSAGIAIALRDPIVNWFGWMFISWRRPFTVGDRVQIGSLYGDVIDIGVSTFSVLEVATPELGEQTTGRIVHVPNGKVFVDPLTNVTQGFNYVWNEIPVTVTFESDWRLAKKLLATILKDRVVSVSEEASRFIRDASRRFLIHSANVQPIVYTRIAEDGVELSLRYVCEARSRRQSTESVCEAVLEAFATEPSIDFAYKTTRIFRQPEEGKTPLRSELPSGKKE